jgi:hypothetical protein
MKERGILFGSSMVRAILAGTKTQTRRLVNTRNVDFIGGREDDHNDPALWGFGDEDGCWHVLDQSAATWTGSGVPHESYAITAPWKVGGRLWVRETWYYDGGDVRNVAPADRDLRLLEYRADHDCRSWEAGCPCNDENGRGSWRPSIHMPRWASRITLEVTGVRVERLQDISDEDARAEGVDTRCLADPDESPECSVGWRNPDGFARDNFRDVWDRINGKRAPWSSNPWVWVVEFRNV